jgi:hypothetical protein
MGLTAWLGLDGLNHGRAGFFGGTAFSISSLSIGSSSFADPPLKTGAIRVTGMLTVAIGSERRRIAPPRPATQTFVPPRYAIENNGELVIVG